MPTKRAAAARAGRRDRKAARHDKKLSERAQKKYARQEPGRERRATHRMKIEGRTTRTAARQSGKSDRAVTRGGAKVAKSKARAARPRNPVASAFKFDSSTKATEIARMKSGTIYREKLIPRFLTISYPVEGAVFPPNLCPPFVEWTDLENDLCVLSSASRLPNELLVYLDLFCNGLLVRHTRIAHIDVDAEIAGHAVS